MCTDLARHARYTMLAAAWLGTLAVGACKGRTNTADTGRVETPAATDTSAMAAPAALRHSSADASLLTSLRELLGDRLSTVPAICVQHGRDESYHGESQYGQADGLQLT